MFSDFGEQIVDGMLDDNFANTGGKDFIPLPYINLVVTANTPPNMHQLTGDRIKLMTFFPIYNSNSKVIEDTLLIPVFVEIKVRFSTQFPNLTYWRRRICGAHVSNLFTTNRNSFKTTCNQH